MRVLLTNDDGVFAPGLAKLAEVFSAAGSEVYVCAPDRQRSAASHCVTVGVAASLRPREVALPGAAKAWAVNGTPADCASLGLFLTRSEPVDLVVSGINEGMNQGGACVYSGTVGAALEAAMCGFQALAVSLCVDPAHRGGEDYEPAARVALRVARWIPEHPLPLGVMYNLNVPLLPYGAIKGIAPAKLAPIFLDPPDYEAEEGPEGVSYRYRGMPRPFSAPDYDTCMTEAGYASLTKLTWDFRLNADDSELYGIEL